MTLLLRLLSSAFITAYCINVVTSSTAQGLRGPNPVEDAEHLGTQRRLQKEPVVCRLTVESTRMSDGTESETTVCIPVKNGRESDRFVPIKLPNSVSLKNKKKINQGRLVMELSNAALTDSDVSFLEDCSFNALSSEEAVKYYDDKDEHRRVLGARPLSTIGQKSIAIIHVSAGGAPNLISRRDLLKAWFGETNSFKSQMENCSSGALQWNAARHYRLRLKEDISSFPGRAEMQAAIEAKLVEKAKKPLRQIADKLVFCYPKGSPGQWMANAAVNWWYAQFNDHWCTSLSSAMHEVGHTVGLLHSSTSDGDEYGDTSGYMGYTGGNPPKCYNGEKNWLMGWYEGRRLSISGEQRVIRLAAFADYDKAAANEPVLVQVNEKYYLQYNSAKSFNSGTELHKNKVTVTVGLDNGDSMNMAGLGVGDSFIKSDVEINVCSAQSGTVDVMVVSIGRRCS